MLPPLLFFYITVLPRKPIDFETFFNSKQRVLSHTKMFPLQTNTFPSSLLKRINSQKAILHLSFTPSAICLCDTHTNAGFCLRWKNINLFPVRVMKQSSLTPWLKNVKRSSGEGCQSSCTRSHSFTVNIPGWPARFRPSRLNVGALICVLASDCQILASAGPFMAARFG